MGFSYIIFLFVLLFPLAYCADPISQLCEHNFTTNNILSENIQKAIYGMVDQTHSNGFSIFSYGVGNETVYGLTRCRGDLSTNDCSECIVAAAQNLQSTCPYSASSRILYDYCYLHYDTNNFHGNIDTKLGGMAHSIKEAEDPQAFNLAVWQLLYLAKMDAASRKNKFGMGKRSFGPNLTIYGMSQCTWDLLRLTCMQCLEKLTSIIISSNCKNYYGCSIDIDNCVIRYEIFNFLMGTVPIFPENGAAAPAPSALA